MIDLYVVGGGVSGLFAAIIASRRGKRVTILEKNNDLGKKILLTGNGRCNFTNEYIDCNCYESSNESKDSFIDTVLRQFDNNDMLHMMQDMGMSYYVREGYYYPKTDLAFTFRETLVNEINRLGVEVVYDFNLREIQNKSDYYVLSDRRRTYNAYNVLISTGGIAAPKSGSSGDSYYYLKRLGHNIIKPLPALVNLRADYPDSILGVNALANITLLIDGTYIDSEYGFIKYYKGMLSGIPIYQLSLKAVSALDRGSNVEIEVDYLYNSCIDKALNIQGLNTYDALCQSINPKIVDTYYRDKFDGNIDLFSHMKYEIIGYADDKAAQSTYGGVDISQIDPATMESKICKGLFLSGEVVDIVGRCGGYNIQWAASSGVAVGRAI